MSTYWYFECLDHDPPLRSQDEFTQHTDDKHFQAGIALVGQRPIEEDYSFYEQDSDGYSTITSYFRMNATKFLSQHDECRIGLINEYGERRSVVGELTE